MPEIENKIYKFGGVLGKIIKVIVVDDSALVRRILSRGLSADPEIQVIATAVDPFQARDLIKKLNPDVLTLDVEMPRMDGVEFLKRMMPVRPMPVLMVSSLTGRGAQITMDALAAGAVDFVTKPSSNVSKGLDNMIVDLREKVKAVSKAKLRKITKYEPVDKTKRSVEDLALHTSTDKVIVIGASTGGTEAIKDVLTRFPGNTPGVVIVQHMPPGFTKMFAERMDKICAMDVKEAEDGDRILQGRVLIAPGDYHMEVVRTGGIYKVKCFKGELMCGHRPSVEVLMTSAAKYLGKNAVAVMLTGMGRDGADGMLKMREAGARTMAQDENTSVVFGMPMEAYKNGGAEKLFPLDKIADEVIAVLKENKI